jgi:glycosyltransferase involved in cell wall biosynthesis
MGASIATRRVNVFVPTLVPSDAVSDQARHQVRLLNSWGHDAVLVADGWHPDCAHEVTGPADALADRPEAAWVVHYSIWPDGLSDILDASTAGPKVFVFHNVTPPDLLPPGPVAERCARALDELPGLAGRWDLVIADSEFNAADLRAAGFSAVEVVPLLIPTAPAPTVERDESVVFVGRVSPSKGVDDLIKAFGLLRRLHRPDATLEIVGSAAGWDRYAAGLEALANEINCGGITFHGGVSEAQRDALYARAGVVCLLSHHEGFCAPLVEAMRAGAPVVARDTGAVHETMNGGGILLPSADPRLASEAIAEVLDDPLLRARLASAATLAIARLDPAEVEERLAATLGVVLR